MKAIVVLNDGIKYNGANEIWECKYDIKSWAVLTGEELTVLGYEIVEEDEYNEYLHLVLSSGETATFRNSYTDLFITHAR